MSIKIAIIGAGSIGFTRKLMQDVLSVPELEETEFSFIDINERNLDMTSDPALLSARFSHYPGSSMKLQSPSREPSTLPSGSTSIPSP